MTHASLLSVCIHLLVPAFGFSGFHLHRRVSVPLFPVSVLSNSCLLGFVSISFSVCVCVFVSSM
eukprot:m.283947 g.283947  ORF g.283947 m.283947 type:complete len:64 (-) comp133119_c0_seq1:62-253(-)